jgi:hypothetical protein
MIKRTQAPKPPDEPCDHPAGSPEKIRTMRQRHGQRRCIHHEADNPAKVEQRRDPAPPPGVYE